MKKYVSAVLAAALMMSISPAAVGAYESDKDWFKWYSSLSEEDQLSISMAPQYRLPDGSLAKGLVSIGGIKYQFDKNGTFIDEYTGWTKSEGYYGGQGVYKYYNNGKRCVGWKKVGDNWFYFFKEGGYAQYSCLIGEKVYMFDGNGHFTGNTYTPEEYGFFEIGEHMIFSPYADSLVRRVMGSADSSFVCMDADLDKHTHTIWLDSFDSLELYKTLTENSEEFEFREAKYSRKYYMSIGDALRSDSIWTEYGISCHFLDPSECRYDIGIEAPENEEALREYLISCGFEEDAFTITPGVFITPV